MPDTCKARIGEASPWSRQPEGNITQSRASEPGRGRGANCPSEIPFNGWQDVFWRLIKSASKDRILATSGSVASIRSLEADLIRRQKTSCHPLKGISEGRFAPRPRPGSEARLCVISPSGCLLQGEASPILALQGIGH